MKMSLFKEIKATFNTISWPDGSEVAKRFWVVILVSLFTALIIISFDLILGLLFKLCF